jgi:SAM-dependent methyltransferase
VEESFYDTLHEVQERHWWYVARREILETVLRRVHDAGVPEGTLYDLGCGVGANLPVLEKFGPTLGIDSSATAVAHCHERGHLNVRQSDIGSLRDLPAESGSVVVLADVIEHLDDDSGCLEAAHRLLKPGGALVVTVPAFMFLWSGVDELSHHRRRYTDTKLREVVSQHFTLEWSSYFNTILFGSVVAVRMMERLLGRDGSDEATIPHPLVNDALRRVFASEKRWLGRVRLPFGVSVLCVARKPPVA